LSREQENELPVLEDLTFPLAGEEHAETYNYKAQVPWRNRHDEANATPVKQLSLSYLSMTG
jgi:hypothetical protein